MLATCPATVAPCPPVGQLLEPPPSMETPSPDSAPVIEVTPPPTAELRGLRLLLPRPATPARVNRLVERAAEAGVNALIVRVYRRGSTLWTSEVAPDWGLPRLRRHLHGHDVLTTLCEACEGAGLHLIAWLDLLPALDRAREWWVLNQFARRHRRRRMRRFTGSSKLTGVESEQMFLCPSWLEVRLMLGDLACEVAERHPIDALWFEGLRFPLGAEKPDTSLCHCQRCRERVKAELDIDLEKMPFDAEREEYLAWTEWREKLLTSLLEELVARVRRVRPGMPIVAGVPAGWQPEPIDRVGLMDWPGWVSSGLLDLACPIEFSSPGAIDLDDRRLRLTNDFEAVDPLGHIAPVLPLEDLHAERPPLRDLMEALPLSGHVWDAYGRLPTDEEWARMREIHGERPALVPELDPLDSMNAIVAETAALTPKGSPLATFLDDLSSVCQRGFGAFSDKQMDTLLEDLEQFEDLGAQGEITVADTERTSRNLNWIQRQLLYLRERQLLTRAH